MNYRLLVTDLDGTVVNEKKQLTPYTKEVIEKLHRRGVWFGVASGRGLVSQGVDHWNLGFPMEFRIGLNGGECYDAIENKMYYYHKLKREWIREIIERMKPFEEDCNCFLYDKDGNVLTQKYDPQIFNPRVKMERSARLAADIHEMCQEEVAVLLFRFDSLARADQAIQYLDQHPSIHYKAFKTQPTMIEFTHRQLSKVLPLLVFCERHQIKMSDVIACGDTSNDNLMLQSAGLGICLINGSDDAKAAADLVTEYDNDHDGLARELARIFNL